MSKIEVSELYPVGLKLFQDSESFLNELTDREMESITGGLVDADLSKLLRDLTVNIKTLNTQVKTVYSVTQKGVGVSYTAKTVVSCSKNPRII